MVSAWLITAAKLPGPVVVLLEPLLSSPKLLMLAIMILMMVVGTALDALKIGGMTGGEFSEAELDKLRAAMKPVIDKPNATMSKATVN